MSNNYLSIILLATSVSCQTFSSDEKTSPASEDSGSKISEDSSSYEETQDTADLIPEETQDTADLISEETDIDLSVCQRWNTDRLNLSEGMWSGAAESCDAGSLTTEGIDNTLRLVNLYRWISGMPEVTTSDLLNQQAQECALIMHAEDTLSHFPDASFACYSESGATAASKSCLSPTAGVEAVDLYMSDPGNSTTLGHRRWILSNGLGPIGLGSTDEYSCMLVVGGEGSSDKLWTAWPPEGDVPIELMHLSWQPVDVSGWSFHSDTINLSSAVATITGESGEDLPVATTVLQEWTGSQYAISIIPIGWSSEVNLSYTVTVQTNTENISYTVRFIDCTQ